jgi:hypothetical protein
LLGGVGLTASIDESYLLTPLGLRNSFIAIGLSKGLKTGLDIPAVIFGGQSFFFLGMSLLCCGQTIQFHIILNRAEPKKNSLLSDLI